MMFSERAMERALEKLLDFAGVLGQAAIVLLVGYIAIKILLGILRRTLNKTPLDASLHTFIENAAKVVLWIVLLITVLGVLGTPLSTFIAVLGAAGAAIALALKDSLSNVAGGIIVLITKPFKQGDYIDIGEVAGAVEKIDLLYTTLKTVDNKVVSIPNGKLTNAVLTNASTEDKRRVDCAFSLGPTASMDKAKELLLAVAEANPAIFQDPAPFVGIAGQGAGGVSIELKVWCKTEEYLMVKYFLEENVKLAFDEAGFSTAYPQVEVRYSK
ncbi:mechanosensitive ion channel family protein [Aminipila butyrica]|uniref:Mechanosensitive ion channel family protein n=1 Tax=Aminipila butyrica TaxID=433296 RepID=A0A858BVJ4_9FIRM|nr:mechanosensitive ion channel family protein [Aminipila butyrica]QIB69128.1 mechanosensitive ion channel family protein [Aminipila butyrica]